MNSKFNIGDRVVALNGQSCVGRIGVIEGFRDDFDVNVRFGKSSFIVPHWYLARADDYSDKFVLRYRMKTREDDDFCTFKEYLDEDDARTALSIAKELCIDKTGLGLYEWILVRVRNVQFEERID